MSGRAVLVLVLVLVFALGPALMANDIPDWSEGPQTFSRALYPDGVSGLNPPTPSYTVAANATVTNRFTLPPGTVRLQFLVNAAGLLFTYNLFVGGHQSNEEYFGSLTAPGSPGAVPTPVLPLTIPVNFEWDTQVDVTLQNTSANALSVFVSAVFVLTPPGQAGASQSVFMPTAAPWQAPLNPPVEIRAAMAIGATLVLVPAIASQTVWCHDFHLISDAAVGAIEWQDTSGVAFSATRLAPAGDNTTGTFGGAPLTKGLGVQINNFSGAAINVWGHLTYSQQ